MKEKATVQSDYSITKLNTMKQDDLKQLWTKYGIKTGNLKKNYLIILIGDY